jgi:hypothetical protein
MRNKCSRQLIAYAGLVLATLFLAACPPTAFLNDIEQKVNSVSAGVTLSVVATAGGTVSPAGSTTVKLGAATPVVATANNGYGFVNWTVVSGSGASFGNAASASTSVTLSSGDVTIQANFTQDFHWLTLQGDGNGTVTTPGTSTVRVASGAQTTIVATASSGYHFKNWTVISGTGVSFGNANNASTTVTLTSGGATIQANFTNVLYQLSIINDGNGSTSPFGTASVSSGAATDIVATPTLGYSFASWTVTTGSGVTFASSGNSIGTNSTDKVTLNSSDATISANFTRTNYQLTIASSGNGTTNPTGPFTVSYGDATAISASAATGHNFASWTVTAGSGVTFTSTGTGSSSSATDTVVLRGGNATIQANFTTTLTVNTSGNGTATPSGATIVNDGEATSISATPNTGNAFVNWTVTSGSGVTFGSSGTAIGTFPSDTVTLTRNATIQANFAIIQYTLNVVTDPEWGTTTPSGTRAVNYGVATNISATANTGWHFVEWTPLQPGNTYGSTGTTESTAAADTITLTAGDQGIGALFAPNMFNVSMQTAGSGAAYGTVDPTGTFTALHGQQYGISAVCFDPLHHFMNWQYTAPTGVTVTFGDANSQFTSLTVTGPNPVIGSVVVQAVFW